MNPGLLRYRIGFYTKQKTPDGMGGNAVTEQLQFSLMARYQGKKGGEKAEFEKVNATNTVHFTVRNTALVNETYTIKHQDKWYNIRSIEPLDTRDMWLVIEAETGVAT